MTEATVVEVEILPIALTLKPVQEIPGVSRQMPHHDGGRGMTKGWLAGLPAVVVLLSCIPLASGAAFQLQWEYPVSGPPARFRIYRQAAACPVSRFLTPQDLRAVSADSEELVSESGAGKNAIDDNPATHWHTVWDQGAQGAGLPHSLVLDLGVPYQVDGVRYLPRQVGGVNGIITAYHVEVSHDGVTWDRTVDGGVFDANRDEKTVRFPASTGRYVRLIAVSEINGKHWTSAAEVRISGAFLASLSGTLVGEVAGSLRTFTDAAVPAGIHCWYVTAVKEDGTESLPCNAVQASPK